MTMVVTWQSPSGSKMSICKACEAALKGNWPKDRVGQEYAQVSYGLHRGNCQALIHDPEDLDRRIGRLAEEAARASDTRQVELCEMALGVGEFAANVTASERREAREECARVLAEAEAMAD